MVSVNDVLEFMWSVAPEAGKESWDNVGHLVGRAGAPVEKILVALDITMPVIREAAENGVQLIVSHHPVIWDTYRHVTDRVFQQDKVLTMIEHHIAAICMHTNLDEAEDGVDDTLAQTLGLTPECHLAEGRIGHICRLEHPVALMEFLPMVQTRLQAAGLRYADAGKPVEKTSRVCGCCWVYQEDALRAGCD